MIKIKEAIVVEGKNDAVAISKAVECYIITTSGLGISSSTKEIILSASQKQGIIIFTDPDYAGEKIRRKIERMVGGNCKHAYLTKKESEKNGDIGIENASPEDITKAIKESKANKMVEEYNYSPKDMIYLGLIGQSDSRKKREFFGRRLNIGYSNGKQMLKKLNSFQISFEDVRNALEEYKNGHK